MKRKPRVLTPRFADSAEGVARVESATQPFTIHVNVIISPCVRMTGRTYGGLEVSRKELAYAFVAAAHLAMYSTT